MVLEKKTLEVLATLVDRLDSGFKGLPPLDYDIPGYDRMNDVLTEVADRLQDNYPYFHPLYAGQMLKPPHPVARLAYALATWINPNKHTHKVR